MFKNFSCFIVSILCFIAAASPSFAGKIVCVYAGPGADPTCVKTISREIESFTQGKVIVAKDEAALIAFLKEHLQRDFCLVLPGGETGYYQSLSGHGDPEIGNRIYGPLKSALKNGASLLGMCAGANIACRDMDARFYYPVDLTHPKAEKDFKDFEFVQPTVMLSLVPAKAYFFSHWMEKERRAQGQWVSVKELDSETKEEFPVYWNSGSYLCVPSDREKEVTILARYGEGALEPNSICALSLHYGKGLVAVSCIHPEFSESDLGDGSKQPTSQVERVGSESQRAARKKFLQRLFTEVGLKSADAQDWQKAYSLEGSPFEYFRHSGNNHGGPYFDNKNPKGPFKAIELKYYDSQIAISIRPNPEFESVVKEVLNAYIEEKIGVQEKTDWGKLVSVKFKDSEGRQFSVENGIDLFGDFTFTISILPHVQETRNHSFQGPITDYGATDRVAAVLNQMSIHEGTTFHENVYRFSVNESKNTRHFIIRDTHLIPVHEFSEIIDLLYKRVAPHSELREPDLGDETKQPSSQVEMTLGETQRTEAEKRLHRLLTEVSLTESKLEVDEPQVNPSSSSSSGALLTSTNLNEVSR